MPNSVTVTDCERDTGCHAHAEEVSRHLGYIPYARYAPPVQARSAHSSGNVTPQDPATRARLGGTGLSRDSEL